MSDVVLTHLYAQVYDWPDGGHYEGQVLNGKRHGNGRMSFSNSPVVYEGEWAGGVRHGHGTLYFNAERSNFYQGELNRVCCIWCAMDASS